MRSPCWDEERVARLTELASAGVVSSEIAVALGASRKGVLNYCTRHHIPLVRFTPEELAAKKQQADLREKRRQAKDTAARRAAIAAKHAESLEGRKASMSRGGYSPLVVDAAHRQTSVAYRAALPPVGQMTKSQLRAMLTQALKNTAEASA